MDVKLIDFDVAGTKTLETVNIYGGGMLGPHYCAPEIFKGESSEKSDMWSIGVILYFMIMGALPFDGDTHEEVIRAVTRGQIKHHNEAIYKSLSPESRDLVETLLQVNPKNRPNAADTLEHPWFQQAVKGTLKKTDLSSALQNLKKFTGHSKVKQAMLGFFV
jgi:serine/threonine protein kinase